MKTFTVLRCFRCSLSPAALPPTDVAGVQDGLTSIRVTWTPPSPPGDTTGYRIHYSTNGGGSSGSVNISDGITNTYTLTGLLRQATYTIFITATSEHLSSTTLTVDPIKLGEFNTMVLR